MFRVNPLLWFPDYLLRQPPADLTIRARVNVPFPLFQSAGATIWL